jgi:3-hydroxybutyryl-CoA dehydrogenase
MGGGIAILTAKANLPTILVEKTQELADAALERITREIDVQIARWAMTESEKRLVLKNLQIGKKLDLAKDVDLVISAVPDDLNLKKQIFGQLEAMCQTHTIFSTITSVLSITELATALTRPEQMIGLHFMSLVLKAKLVEIVRGVKTSQKTYETSKAFIHKLGKIGIEVFESPGFVTTRLIAPLINEAMYVLMERVASAEDIETAMRFGYNMPMGPLELADRIGLDTLLNLMNHLFRETGELKFRPCPLLKKFVRAQYLGVKTGEGFFKYDLETEQRQPFFVHRELL